MLILFSFILLLSFETSACVYSQSYWLSNASKPWPIHIFPLNQPLCGETWHTLMVLNTSQVREPGATQWLLIFHQLCSAVLNANVNNASSSSSSYIPASISLAINAVFDSMQRRCDNLSGWVQELTVDTVLGAHVSTLIQYNHGGEACNPTNVLPFSFTQDPQLFFIDYNETAATEMKRQADLIASVYYVQGLLSFYAAVITFVCVMLSLYAIMLRSRRREYSCCRSTDESLTYNVNGDDQEIDLDDEDDDMDIRIKQKDH